MSARIWTRSFASRFESGSSIRKTLRLAHDRAAHRHALALAARELGRLALEVLLEAEQLRDLAHARARAPTSSTLAIFSGKPMFASTVRYG